MKLPGSAKFNYFPIFKLIELGKQRTKDILVEYTFGEAGS